MRKTPEERFWEKVDIKGEDDCWEWVAGKNWYGYGTMHIESKCYYAHRLSWIICYGKIKDNMCILHHCDNPACVNPKHLYMGTKADNARDMYQRNRVMRNRGEEHPMSILKESDVIDIKRKYKKRKYTTIRLGEEYGVSRETIQHIISGITWRHIK